MTIFMICCLTKYNYGDRIQLKKMGETYCDTCGEEKCIRGLWGKTRANSKDLVDGRIILKCYLKDHRIAWTGLICLKIKTNGRLL
jgi:hypothetical protein